MCIGLHVEYSYFFLILMKRTFLTDFRKMIKYKFPWKLFSGNQVVSCRRKDRQTDNHDEANSYFLQFFNAPKNELKLPAVKYKVTQ
jgi:hypothetical protein